MAWYFWVILIVIVFSLLLYVSNKAKRERLMKKYNNEELVDKLMNGSFWQGQAKGELLDSLGTPSDVDEKVLKTKIKETWKYQKTGNNRYALKIFI